MKMEEYQLRNCRLFLYRSIRDGCNWHETPGTDLRYSIALNVSARTSPKG